MFSQEPMNGARRARQAHFRLLETFITRQIVQEPWDPAFGLTLQEAHRASQAHDPPPAGPAEGGDGEEHVKDLVEPAHQQEALPPGASSIC